MITVVPAPTASALRQRLLPPAPLAVPVLACLQLQRSFLYRYRLQCGAAAAHAFTRAQFFMQSLSACSAIHPCSLQRMSSPTSAAASRTSPVRAASSSRLAATAPSAAAAPPPPAPSSRPARPVPGKDPDSESFESQLRAQKKAHENAELEKAKALELQRRRDANISRLSKQLEEEKRRSELEITLMKGLRTPGKVSITIKSGKDIRSREVGRSLDLYAPLPRCASSAPNKTVV